MVAAGSYRPEADFKTDVLWENKQGRSLCSSNRKVLTHKKSPQSTPRLIARFHGQKIIGVQLLLYPLESYVSITGVKKSGDRIPIAAGARYGEAPL